MAMLCNWHCKFLIGLGLISWVVPAHSNAGAVPRQDRAWKHYTNSHLGYCISYPRRWQKGEAFDGAGIYAAVTPKHSTFPIGAMDVSAFADTQPSLKNVSLSSDVQAHLDGLRRFVRAQHTEVLEQHAFSMSGTDGLYLKARYFDPHDRAPWVEEVIFARSGGVLYRLEMQTREGFLPRFEPVFARFAQSFELHCGNTKSALR